MPIPYLAGAYVIEEKAATATGFPFTLPFVRTLNVKLDKRVTVFVGENGSGKSTLEARENDPYFGGDPYALYGGKSIRHRSHGEGVRALLKSHDKPGLYFFDEPEAALSPMAQVEFVKLINARVATDNFQFVIATHSPLVMSIDGAQLICLHGGELRPTKKELTNHWKTYAALFAKGTV